MQEWQDSKEERDCNDRSAVGWRTFGISAPLFLCSLHLCLLNSAWVMFSWNDILYPAGASMNLSVRRPFAIALPPPGVGADDLGAVEWTVVANGRNARAGGKDGRRGSIDFLSLERLPKAAGDSGDGTKVVGRDMVAVAN